MASDQLGDHSMMKDYAWEWLRLELGKAIIPYLRCIDRAINPLGLLKPNSPD